MDQNLNIRTVTIKLLKENVGKKAAIVALPDNFWVSQKRKPTHPKIRQIDPIKLKSFP